MFGLFYYYLIALPYCTLLSADRYTINGKWSATVISLLMLSILPFVSLLAIILDYSHSSCPDMLYFPPRFFFILLFILSRCPYFISLNIFLLRLIIILSFNLLFIASFHFAIWWPLFLRSLQWNPRHQTVFYFPSRIFYLISFINFISHFYKSLRLDWPVLF